MTISSVFRQFNIRMANIAGSTVLSEMFVRLLYSKFSFREVSSDKVGNLVLQ